MAGSDMNEQDRNQLQVLQNSFNAFKGEMTESLRQINASVARIANTISGDPENDIDGIVVKVRKLAEDIEAVREREKGYHADHEARIEKLEQGQTKIFAYSAAIAVMIGTLWQAGKLLFDIWTR